jgi:beta-glucosidase
MHRKELGTVIFLACAAVGNGVHAAGDGSPPFLTDLEDWPRPALRAPDPALEERVAALLARLSTEEKVGQIIQADISTVTPEDVRRLHLGSVLNGGNSGPGNDDRASAEKWLELADAFFDASTDDSDGRVAIPVIWGTDAVHGHSNIIGATVFPHNIALGATRDADLVRRIGRVTAREIAVTGMEWNFAPTVAVVRNDRWGRTYEGYSESPAVVRVLGAAMVEGLQGSLNDSGRLRGERVIATAKHFVGDGGTVDGVDQGDNVASPAELRRLHAAGYIAAIEAGVETVMASYNSWHGRKVHGYAPLLTGLLKEHWGFDGFVVGDWNAHGQIESCTNVSCPNAINAGLDMFMAPDSWRELYRNTLASVQSGQIPAERLDDAVSRILRVKLRAGMLERPKPSARPLAGRFELLGGPAHRSVAREAVRKSLVLLKNDPQVLPVKGGARVLVAGEAADNLAQQTGGWTVSWQGDGNARESFPNGESIWEGISRAVEGAGGTAQLSVDGTWSERPDVAVLVFGEQPYAEGFGDIPDVDFRSTTFDHMAVLERWQEQGIPTVSVFISGRPLWVDPELDLSDAFVAAWLPGSEGAGIADVLIGDRSGAPRHDFSGKLPYSWPRTPGQAAVNVGDAAYDPRFEFGYGLAYADAPEAPASP